MRISDWSSDVCSSDLKEVARGTARPGRTRVRRARAWRHRLRGKLLRFRSPARPTPAPGWRAAVVRSHRGRQRGPRGTAPLATPGRSARRSEEHTSELQSLMRISYAVFCLKKKKKQQKMITLT